MAVAPEVESVNPPKEYLRPIPATWWLKRPAYVRFMVREATGAFIAGYAVFLIVMMRKAEDPAAFQQFVDRLLNPIGLALHAIVLLFALYHSVTFFGLTPKVLKVRRGEEQAPELAVIAAHYAMWLAASVVLFYLVLR